MTSSEPSWDCCNGAFEHVRVEDALDRSSATGSDFTFCEDSLAVLALEELTDFSENSATHAEEAAEGARRLVFRNEFLELQLQRALAQIVDLQAENRRILNQNERLRHELQQRSLPPASLERARFRAASRQLALADRHRIPTVSHLANSAKQTWKASNHRSATCMARAKGPTPSSCSWAGKGKNRLSVGKLQW
eukprot:NODE_3894_length_898_cov_36.257951_g3584_i0.p1 GENE.NODE_3894_length_898_cov_36.257951_g3584_i0~~NODE_3894_length_898_cov_36.257951_g3584_i0.p1  ORF type:complete len:193 (-),score=36.52 NODE_3894_length_898_cov_36.257951_g3584_i0:219-797(-)